MKRLTYRDENNRARLTVQGKRIYCSTQATADTIAKYEELLEKLGYVFDNRSVMKCVLSSSSVKESLHNQINDELEGF